MNNIQDDKDNEAEYGQNQTNLINENMNSETTSPISARHTDSHPTPFSLLSLSNDR